MYAYVVCVYLKVSMLCGAEGGICSYMQQLLTTAPSSCYLKLVSNSGNFARALALKADIREVHPDDYSKAFAGDSGPEQRPPPHMCPPGMSILHYAKLLSCS
jgi:hypothetical protein